MNKRSKWVSILAGIMAVIMVLGLVAGVIPMLTSAEQTSAEIKAELDRLKGQKQEIENKLKDLQSQLSDNKSDMQALLTQKDILDQEVAVLNQKKDNINQQIAVYVDMIADKQEELDEAQAHLEELRAKNKERIRAMEMGGKVTYWSVLFQANSFTDLLDRMNMVEQIAVSDQRRLEEMSKAAEQVQKAQSELQLEKSELEKSREELAESEKVLAKKQEEANALLAELLKKGDEYQTLVDQAEDRKDALMDQINSKQDDYDEAKQKEYEQWLEQNPSIGGNTPGNNVDGITWLVPIDYVAMTSPYGYRWHPIHGDWRLHNGVDLAAPQGRPIYATRSGRVSVAAYEAGGAGYYVYIDHMDGFKSVYMHMTHYIVSVGQYVQQGQVIGYCGSTGGSTGPHLHFGIYQNGKSVNPAYFINI